MQLNAERFVSFLKMPLPPPIMSPMSPKRRQDKEKEVDKEQERREQRENVLSTFRSVNVASADFDVSETATEAPPLTLQGIMSAMSGLLRDQSDNLEKKIDNLEKKIDSKIDDLEKKIDSKIDRALKEMGEEHKKELDILNKGVTQKVEGVEATVQTLDRKLEDQAIVAEARQMEFAIRIRGIKETVVNLELEAAAGLANGMGFTQLEVQHMIDKMYRVNSRAAKSRDLPRDLVIYFTKRAFRDQIIRKSFEKKFQIAGQEVIVMKELPSRYIKRRKEYSFLVDELRKRKIRFRWEVPDGITASYQGSSIKITSIPEARDLFERLMREDAPIEQEEVPGPVPVAVELEEERETEDLGGGGARPKRTARPKRYRRGQGGTGKRKGCKIE